MPITDRIYLAVINMQYAPKNMLQRDVLEYFKTINRKYIYADEFLVEDYKREIQEHIYKLNAKHQRCKSLDPSWYKIGNSEDWHLDQSSIPVVSFTLYISKEKPPFHYL